VPKGVEAPQTGNQHQAAAAIICFWFLFYFFLSFHVNTEGCDFPPAVVPEGVKYTQATKRITGEKKMSS
jgi:hypothetical protein